MIYNNHLDFVFDDIYTKIDQLIGIPNSFLKCEGFSIGGSIKIKPALKMISRLEMQGLIDQKSSIIESSSGNLGVALSIVCASKGIPFICVVDPNIQQENKRIMETYGAKIVKVDKKDSNGGYLNTRIDTIKTMCSMNPNLVWPNQYENIDNLEAHYLTTAKSIHQHFPDLDYLFVGAGTTGTLSGVSKYVRSNMPTTKIIAVDSIGSVTFDGTPGTRYISGLGASKTPPLSKHCSYDELIRVHESDTLTMCHNLAGKGLLVGGSTGTVLCAMKYLQKDLPKGATMLAISPDFGERYMGTLYNSDWYNSKFY
ncbi:TPA: 2,3-diaminopropionate biosynthesis protein SbnA [Vibrio parahaemolyticus]